MEINGKLNGVSQDMVTGNMLVTFATSQKIASNTIEEIKDIELSIKAVKKRKKRSLDANAYAWVLMQKMAEKLKTDRWSIYLEMLQRYSRAFTFIVVKTEAMERVKDMWRTVIDMGEVNVNGSKAHQLQVFYGSSTFNSKEMSVFIDGIVTECKDLNIETMTPYELQELKSLWNQ